MANGQAQTEGGTTVRYGAVTIYGATTREFRQTVEYDPSGTDPIYNRFTVAFDGWVHADDVAMQNVNKPSVQPIMAGDAPGIIAYLRSYLMAPRQPLVIRMGGTEILRAIPAAATSATMQQTDVNNGPKPRGVDISNVVGGSILRVRWSCEVCLVLCNSPNIRPGGGQEVLSNRWSIAESMDGNFFITRTITGRLILASARVSPQSFKTLVVPGLEDGFKRRAISYTVAADGLAVDYSVVDKQVHTAAPWPATSISGNHSEQTGDGVNYFSSVDVTLEGPPHVDKKWLIIRALHVTESRIKWNQRLHENKAFITGVSITDQFGERNIISMSVKLRSLPEDLDAYVANLQRNHLGQELKLPPLPGPTKKDPDTIYVSKRSPVPDLWGYDVGGGVRSPAVATLFGCYLQTPCGPEHSITGKGPGGKDKKEDGRMGDRYKPDVTGSIATELPRSNKTEYDPMAVAKPVYTLYRIQSTYQWAGGVVQLPYSMSLVDSQGGPQESYRDEGRDESPTSAFVQVAPTMARRIITVEAERVGAWPEIPSPENYKDYDGQQGYLLNYERTPLGVAPSQSGDQRVYRVHARYVYGLIRPNEWGRMLPIGHNPILKVGPGDDRFLQDYAYSKKVGPT